MSTRRNLKKGKLWKPGCYTNPVSSQWGLAFHSSRAKATEMKAAATRSLCASNFIFTTFKEKKKETMKNLRYEGVGKGRSKDEARIEM